MNIPVIADPAAFFEAHKERAMDVLPLSTDTPLVVPIPLITQQQGAQNVSKRRLPVDIHPGTGMYFGTYRGLGIKMGVVANCIDQVAHGRQEVIPADGRGLLVIDGLSAAGVNGLLAYLREHALTSAQEVGNFLQHAHKQYQDHDTLIGENEPNDAYPLFRIRNILNPDDRNRFAGEDAEYQAVAGEQGNAGIYARTPQQAKALFLPGPIAVRVEKDKNPASFSEGIALVRIGDNVKLLMPQALTREFLKPNGACITNEDRVAIGNPSTEVAAPEISQKVEDIGHNWD